MKAKFFPTCLRVVFVGIVLGASFVLGRWPWSEWVTPSVPPEATLNSRPKPVPKPNLPAARPPSSANRLPPKPIEDNIARLSEMLNGNWPRGEKTDQTKATAVRTLLRNGNIDAGQVPAIVAALKDFPDSRDKNIMLNELIGRLAGNYPSRDGMDPDVALQLVDNVTDPAMHKNLLRGIYVLMAEMDPVRGFSEIAKLPSGIISAADFSNIFSSMAAKDPAAAMAVLNSLPDGPNHDNAVKGVANGWLRADPKAALEWISSLAPDVAQPLLTNALTRPGALGTNPQIAALYVDKLVDPAARDQAIGAITPGLARANPAGALAWLGNVSTGDAYAKGVASIFNLLVAPESETKLMAGGATMTSGIGGLHDPAAAVALLNKVTDPAARTGAIGEIAAGWAKTDPAAAVNWAASLPAADTAASTAALNTIVAGWTKNDPEAAAAFVQKSGNPSAFLPDAPAIADSLSKYDATAALNFVQTLPDGAARDQAVNNVLVNASATDFPTAWNFATSLPAGPSRDAAMDSLVTTAAAKDPAQALPLLDEFSAGTVRNGATRALAKTWAAQDPQAASIWMQSLPPSTQRNVAIVELITAQVNKDPASTLQWANAVTTDTTRANQIQRVITTWAKSDPAAALNAIPSANLPDDQKAALVQGIQQAQAKAK